MRLIFLPLVHFVMAFVCGWFAADARNRGNIIWSYLFVFLALMTGITGAWAVVE